MNRILKPTKIPFHYSLSPCAVPVLWRGRGWSPPAFHFTCCWRAGAAGGAGEGGWRNFFRALGIFFIAIFFLLTFFSPLQASSPKALHIGLITEFPMEELKWIRPFTDYLATQLKPYGIQEVHPVITGGVPAMAYLIRKGKVDMLIESPLTTYAVQQLADLEILLRQWREGLPGYQSVIFVNDPSPIKSLEDLKGKIIVLTGPYSTSGYWLPKYQLSKLGLKPFRAGSLHEEIPEGRVAYIFSYDNQDGIRWVERGIVAAGAMNRESLEKSQMAENKFRIVFESWVWPRQLVSVRSVLPPDLVLAVKKTLLNMDESPEGREVLKEFEHTTRFDLIPGGTEKLEKSFQPFRTFIRRSLGLQ